MIDPPHHRHSARLKGYDYSQNGAYFVTLCTWQRKEIFGKIISDEMQLNDWGKIVQQAWLNANRGFPHVSTDVFVIMPNHIHGIIVIDHPGTIRSESTIEAPVIGWGPPTRPAGTSDGSLGTIIAQFKSKASKKIMAATGRISVIPGQIWQRNYYEHIIRNEPEWDRIRKYIQTNPANWSLDDENPEGPHRSSLPTYPG